MDRVDRFIEWLNSIGISIADPARIRSAKNLVVYLALFMSFGGFVWGSLLLYYNLPYAALIPYSYIVISLLNIFAFGRSHKFYLTAAIQIIISMCLPFILQWQMGGFVASGCVMLWSALSLIGAIILLQGHKVYPYLSLYLLLVLFSFWFDSYFAMRTPAILTHNVSQLMLLINIIMIASAGFALLKSKVDKDHKTQIKLEDLQKQYQDNLAAEREIRNKLEVSENREGRIRKELETVVSSIDDIVVEFDEVGRFKNFWCRDELMLSRPVSYYLGKTLAEAFSYVPTFADKAQQVYEKVCLSGKPYVIEIDSTILPTSRSYEFRLNPILESEGSIKRCSVLVTDITARKLAERRLKEAFQTRNVLVENLDGGIIIEDESGRVLLANKEFYQLFDITASPDQLMGSDGQTPDLSKYFFQSPENFAARIMKILQIKTKVLNEELPMVDGRVLERDYIPIIVNDSYRGHLWHYRDVTSRKQTELALRNAKEEAEESNRLKTIFLGNLSHEVRTPLQGILGFAEILENPKLQEEKRREYINIIKRRTADMQNIIESLLDMASLETGEIRAFPVQTNLNEAIEDIFSKVKQDHDLTGKSIQLVLKNNLKPISLVKIDTQHLHQVVRNLISNAIKFTNSGLVVLSCEELPSTFRINLVDSGIGISPDKIEHIFEPFRQAHEGISRSKGGIGLGLSICKKMVEMWGGTIHVVSTPDIGSTFCFEIPIPGVKNME